MYADSDVFKLFHREAEFGEDFVKPLSVFLHAASPAQIYIWIEVPHRHY